MKNIIWFAFAALCTLMLACQSTDDVPWKETDLMSYGLPVKVKAPIDLEVSRSSISDIEEYNLQGPGGYGMNVLVLEATTNKVSKIKNELEDLIKEGKYFTHFIESDESGFVYEIFIDSTHIVYGFRKIKIQGSKQFIFQNPYMSRLSKDQALNLYNAILE